MLSLTEAAKKKLNLESLTRTNRSVIYTYALSDVKVIRTDRKFEAQVLIMK